MRACHPRRSGCIVTETWWAAVLDGDKEGADLRSSRAEAVRDARWLRRHPARLDRRKYGHGGVVEVVHLAECEWTGELIEVGA